MALRDSDDNYKNAIIMPSECGRRISIYPFPNELCVVFVCVQRVVIVVLHTIHGQSHSKSGALVSHLIRREYENERMVCELHNPHEKFGNAKNGSFAAVCFVFLYTFFSHIFWLALILSMLVSAHPDKSARWSSLFECINWCDN